MLRTKAQTSILQAGIVNENELKLNALVILIISYWQTAIGVMVGFRISPRRPESEQKASDMPAFCSGGRYCIMQLSA